MNERLKTFLLWTLSFLLLIQVRAIWFQLPEPSLKARAPENFESSQLKEDLLGPKKILIHFSPKDHTVLYKTKDYWPIVRRGLDGVYGSFKDSLEADSLSEDDYIQKIDQGRVVSLCFSGVLDHGNWAQLLGLDVSHLTKRIQGKLLGLDVFLDEDSLIFTTDQGHFLLPMTIHTLGDLKGKVGQMYDSRRYRNYTSFYEKYGIKNLSYVPRINTQPPQSIPLENKLRTLDSSVESNLARRFLRENIDYIREITEKNAVTYVYDQKVLRLNNNGWLNYSDGEKPGNYETSLVQSLDTALDFITTRTGTSEALYLKEAKEVPSDQGSSYLFSFGMETNYRRVYRLSKENYQARILLTNNKVQKLDFLYQRPEETDFNESIDTTKESLSPEDTIEKNLGILSPGGESLEETLTKVDFIDAAYVDLEKPGGHEDLKPVWCISIQGRLYLMDMKTGAILMGGENGLV